MVTTRSKGQSASAVTKDTIEPKTGEKRPQKKVDGKSQEPAAQKKVKTDHKAKVATKTVDPIDALPKDVGNQKQLINNLTEKYGEIPLSYTSLKQPDKATAETMQALILNAILSSTRISHTIAAKTVAEVIKAGYHKLDTLKKSTWEERTRVLTDGGYTHYRETGATTMGELAETIENKYDGDLNNILKKTNRDPAKIRAEVKSIKGLGDVGVDIFFDTAQHLWPCLAPFVDARSINTASKIGLGDDIQALWNIVEKNPKKMVKLASALTTVRLDKKEAEFTE